VRRGKGRQQKRKEDLRRRARGELDRAVSTRRSSAKEEEKKRAGLEGKAKG